MALRKLTIVLAVAGLAANLYMKSRRTAANPRTGGFGAGAESEPGPSPFPTGAQARSNADPADSPNAAERLQAGRLGGAGAGIAASMADDGNHDDLLSAAPGKSSDNAAPGLPDFFRGA
jgi:hypothetical protein